MLYVIDDQCLLSEYLCSKFFAISILCLSFLGVDTILGSMWCPEYLETLQIQIQQERKTHMSQHLQQKS